MSNHLGQIYSTTKNAEKYIVLNSQNVELSGNVKLTNGNLDISQNLIFNNFSVTDKINFRENSGSTSYNIINNSLTSNNDASLNNVEINGTIKLPDSSNNGYGDSGQILQSNADNNPPSWVNAPPIVIQGATDGYLNVLWTQLTSTGRHNARNFNSLGSSWIFNTTGSAVVPCNVVGGSGDGLIRFAVAGVYSITVGFLSVSNPTSRGRYIYAKYRNGPSGSWFDFKSSHFVDGQSPQVSDYFYQASVTTTFLYTAAVNDEITFDLRFDYVNNDGYVYGHYTANSMYRETFIHAHKVA